MLAPDNSYGIAYFITPSARIGTTNTLHDNNQIWKNSSTVIYFCIPLINRAVEPVWVDLFVICTSCLHGVLSSFGTHLLRLLISCISLSMGY